MAAAVAALLATGAASGCSSTNPQTTAFPYLPADGQVVQLGAEREGVTVASFHVVTRAAGEPGVLLARVVNTSAVPHRVTFTAADLDQAVSVPGHSTLDVGGVEEGSVLVRIPAVSEAPGQLLPMEVAVEGGPAEHVEVPVMDGTLDRYAPYVRLAESGDGRA